MDSATYSSWLRRRWWVVGLCLVLGLALGLGSGLRLAGSGYSSSAQLLISGGGSPGDQSDSAYDSNYLDQRMPLYAQAATSGDVLAAASRRLGVTPAALAPRVSASVGSGTTIVTVAVQGSSPQDAIDGDRAVVETTRAAITAQETVIGQPARVTTTLIAPPSDPVARSLPSPWVFGGAGALAGLLLGLLAGAVCSSETLSRAIAWAQGERRIGEAPPPDPSGVPVRAPGPPAPHRVAAPPWLGSAPAGPAWTEADSSAMVASAPDRAGPPS